MTDKKILAIIPARSGSKRLPGKNIIDLCGKPLIYYTIMSAKRSKYITKTVVSTDSEEIAKISMDYGAEVIIRPPELATDTASSFDVVKHAIEYMKMYFDLIILLEPTSVLRLDDDIDNAIRLFVREENKGTNPEAVVSVGKVALENPYVMKIINRNGFIQPLINSKKQEIAYFPYGVLYLIKKDILMEQKTFYPERTLPYFLNRFQNYEVDTIEDLKCVEAIMKWKNETL